MSMMLERFADWKMSFGGGTIGSILAAPGARDALHGSTSVYDWVSLGVAAFGVLVAAGSLAFKVYTWKKEHEGNWGTGKPRQVPQKSGGGGQPKKGGN